MVMVVIIGLLAAIAIPGFRHAIATTQPIAPSPQEHRRRKAVGSAAIALQRHTRDAGLFGEHYIEHKPDCPAGAHKHAVRGGSAASPHTNWALSGSILHSHRKAVVACFNSQIEIARRRQIS